jgi:chemotaxis protein methyltransferase CheR
LHYLSIDEFNLIKDVIYHESGISFSDTNRPILESRIKERCRKNQITSPTDYYNLVKDNPEELKLLLDSVTTNLTKFFRNDSHFKTLKEDVIPELSKRKVDRKIKVWSAGCSTGEEPYSVLMYLEEYLPDPDSWSIEIIASDISLKSLLVAKAGFYPTERCEVIEPSFLSKYFDAVDNGYKIKDFYKAKIRFDYHNLKYDNGERDFDIILCRNVIIYFDKKAQEEVIKKFETCLSKDGYLFLGHSESLYGMQTAFKFNKIGDACLYRKDTSGM